MAMNEEMLKDWRGVVIGYIKTDPLNGDKTAFDRYHKILGRYNKRLNITVNFSGIKVADGDVTQGLVWRETK